MSTSDKVFTGTWRDYDCATWQKKNRVMHSVIQSNTIYMNYDGLVVGLKDEYKNKMKKFLLTHKDVIKDPKNIPNSWLIEHKDVLNWAYILKNCTLCETTILICKRHICASLVCQYQDLSLEFIQKNLNWLNSYAVSKYCKINKGFYELNKETLDYAGWTSNKNYKE